MGNQICSAQLITFLDIRDVLVNLLKMFIFLVCIVLFDKLYQYTKCKIFFQTIFLHPDFFDTLFLDILFGLNLGFRINRRNHRSGKIYQSVVVKLSFLNSLTPYAEVNSSVGPMGVREVWKTR